MRSKPSWPHDDILHAWWVEPDRLLAGEYPSSTDPARAAQKRRVLIEAGVDTIVDLTEDGEMSSPYYDLLREEAAKSGRNVPRHIRYPIPDTHIVDDQDYDRILAEIQRAISAGGVVYVHCWGGKGRTCTVIGCWLIDNDRLDYDRTLKRMQDLRRGTKKACHHVPDTRAQHNVLRRRAARRERESELLTAEGTD